MYFERVSDLGSMGWAADESYIVVKTPVTIYKNYTFKDMQEYNTKSKGGEPVASVSVPPGKEIEVLGINYNKPYLYPNRQTWLRIKYQGPGETFEKPWYIEYTEVINKVVDFIGPLAPRAFTDYEIQEGVRQQVIDKVKKSKSDLLKAAASVKDAADKAKKAELDALSASNMPNSILTIAAFDKAAIAANNAISALGLVTQIRQISGFWRWDLGVISEAEANKIQSDALAMKNAALKSRDSARNYINIAKANEERSGGSIYPPEPKIPTRILPGSQESVPSTPKSVPSTLTTTSQKSKSSNIYWILGGIAAVGVASVVIFLYTKKNRRNKPDNKERR